MAKITFYRQGRRDHGVRSGVDVDGDSALARYEPGSGEVDPSLDWYVDLEWIGPSLPQEAEAVRSLLVGQAAAVRSACEALGGRLVLGIDEEPTPFAEAIATDLPGVEAKLFCSAVRRVSGREMGQQLTFIGSSWPRLLAELEAVSAQAA